MDFKRFLEEQKEKHAVLAFGRMNPPTVGHAKLVDKVKEVAKEVGGTHHVVISHSQDEKKNPLSAQDKLKHAKRFFPDTNLSTSDKEHPTFLQHAAKLHKAGVTHLHMIAGSDRVDEYKTKLAQYNGKHKGALYNFKHITVHSAGERDPDAEGVSGMSASKMRGHAEKGNFKEFKKGIPKHVAPEHAKELYHDVRKGMNLKEDMNYFFEQLLTEGVHDKAIFKAVFLSGGPGSGKDYVLDNTLAGHGLTEINSDKALEFLMDKKNLDKTMPASEKDARDIVRGKAKDLTELRQRLALLGRNGLIINGTGDDPKKYAKIKKELEELGYETSMIAVNTKDEVSSKRNIERGQRGGRTVPENIRKEKWDSVNNARPEMAKLFGTNYMEFDNSEDLRSAQPEVVKAKKEELLQLYKGIQDFVKRPPKNQQASSWIAGELSKKDTLPVPKKGAEQMGPDGSGAAEEARKLGLQYFGFGRYGKNGKVTHHSVHDKLVQDPTHVEQEKMAKKAANVTASGASGSVPKKKVNESMLNEAITVTFTADTADELNQAFQMFNKNDKEADVEEETSYQLSNSNAYNVLTLGTGMLREEISPFKQKVKHSDGHTYVGKDNRPRVFAIRNNAAKEAHRQDGEVVRHEKGYMVKLKESTDATTNQEFLQETNTTSGRETSTRHSEISGTITCAPGSGTVTITEHCGDSSAHIGDGSTYDPTRSESRIKGKIYLSQVKEQWKKKINEIDQGIEPGMSMAAGGESISRDMGEVIGKNGKATPLKKKV